MSTTFIPAGTTERHDHVTADTLIVNGTLLVSGTIRAKRICGNGTIVAKSIRATSITASVLDAEHISGRTVLADKVLCFTAFVSLGIIAKDYIEARTVKTKRLSSAVSNIDRIEAGEVITLKPKSSFIRAIFYSWLKERFASRRHKKAVKKLVKSYVSGKSKKDSANRYETEYENVVAAYREKYTTGEYRLVLEHCPRKPEEMRDVA